MNAFEHLLNLQWVLFEILDDLQDKLRYSQISWYIEILVRQPLNNVLFMMLLYKYNIIINFILMLS